MTERLDDIRHDLASRIAALAGERATRRLANDVDTVRRIALAAGLLPAVAVAHALEAALLRGERGPLIRGWLDLLRDAVGCEASDAHACETYAAACSVRYG